MIPSHTVKPLFDDPNLVSAAGLVPAMLLGESAGLHSRLDEHLTVNTPNAVLKATGVVAGMLAGTDSIDGLDVLRHGGMRRLFAGVRAPSTLGTFLRSFTHGHVQQLDAAGRELLAGLVGRVPRLLADAGAGGIGFIDVDDTVREVHGYAKQAAGYGYTKVRGLNVQLAAVSTPRAAPMVAGVRLRRGNTGSAAGAGRMLAQAITTARAAGVSGQIMCRADSAYYGWAFCGTAVRHHAWFSVTARMTATVKTAIAGIDAQTWTAIKYPHAIWEAAEGRWVSDADVAEVPFTAFTGRRKAEHVECRLVVRRVKRLQPLAGDGTEQGELFATYRYHALITNSTLSTVAADERHRGHAVIEQVIAEFKDGPLAHLPSGSYAANAAWVSLAAIAFNIARGFDALGAPGRARARWASVRTRLINVPARIAATGRRLVLHLPRDWPWADQWQTAFTAATGPPTATEA